MGNLIKNFQIFESTQNEELKGTGREISNKDIYLEAIADGKTPDAAAEFLMDIVTGGIWAMWEQERIDSFKAAIIKKYSE